MEIPLEQLSASKLRTLLIEEVKSFVESLDKGISQELEEKRRHLIMIFKLLSEKEEIEMMPLAWGKNSAKSPG
jgi:hypothetical protein